MSGYVKKYSREETEAIQHRILRCLKKYGPFTTTQLHTRVGLSRGTFIQNALVLYRQGAVTREIVGKTGRHLIEHLWTYFCDRRDDDEEDVKSLAGITPADDAWQAYWLLPPVERRAIPPPDYDPTFPRTGGDYDLGIPQPSHASRNAWRTHA